MNAEPFFHAHCTTTTVAGFAKVVAMKAKLEAALRYNIYIYICSCAVVDAGFRNDCCWFFSSFSMIDIVIVH